jgi:NitT/TauT family transport system substrate-binding protein
MEAPRVKRQPASALSQRDENGGTKVRSITRSKFLTVAASLLLVLLAACRETPAGGDGGEGAGGGDESGKVTLAVGGQAAMVYLPTTLAVELGYYEDEGLEVSIEDFEGGSEALQSLLGGSADVVSGLYDHTIEMAAEGNVLKSFVTMLQYPGLKLIVAPGHEDEIDSPADLDGKAVGVTAPGSSTDLFLKFLLSKNDLDPEAASVVAIGATATAVAAMEKGKVDAGVMIEPAVAALEDRAGELEILADTSTQEGVQDVFGVDSYPASVLYASSEWIEANPETAEKLARAIVKTLDYIESHSVEEIMAEMPEEFVGAEPEIYRQGMESTLESFSIDGVMQEGGPEAVHEVLSLSLEEVESADIDLSNTYTNEFVE